MVPEGRPKCCAAFVLIWLCACLGLASAAESDTKSPVTTAHVQTITSLFRENGLSGATLALDGNGKVVLGGSYRDAQEVQVAFTLAMSVVGARWTSPVNPGNIEIWAKGKKFSAPAAVAKHDGRRHDPKDAGRPKEGYALIVGIGAFKAEGITQLRYAAGDARRFYNYLSKDVSGKYRKENVTLLVNEQATAGNIYHALEELRAKAAVNDDVIIYFSSHGIPAFDGSMNIVAYDTDYSKKSKIKTIQTSIPATTINDFLKGVEAKRVLVVYDVCYSGAAFKNAGAYYDVAGPINPHDDTTGFSKGAMATSLLGSKDIVFEDDVVKSDGGGDGDKLKVIMSASSADEKSWESDTVKSSIFTYYFVKALQSSGNVKLAFDVARARVSYLVKQEKKAEQHPQAISTSVQWNDFFLDK